MRRVLETGEATWNEAMLLLLNRFGSPEETYHTFSYSPLYDDAGKVANRATSNLPVRDGVPAAGNLSFASRIDDAANIRAQWYRADRLRHDLREDQPG